MKRRIIIFGGATALYLALMAVTWIIGTRQAEQKTESMLDYAVNDMRLTLDGAIDTVLEHLACTTVRHFQKPVAHSLAKMSAVAAEFDIDELCLIDRTGLIVATNDPDSQGVNMNAAAETRPYSALTNGVTRVVSQPFRRHAYSHSRRKYLGVPFPNGDGYVQIGFDESRMYKMLSTQLAFLFDAQMEDTVCYLCADVKTGELVSKHFEAGMPKTLDEIGFDFAKAPDVDKPLSGVESDGFGKTFEQTLYGRRTFCRAFVFGGHRFFMIEPEDEFFGTRDLIAGVMALLLALVLGSFAFLLDRIFSDADRLRAFYAAADEARAKDMEIAKSIQDSVLPVPLGESPYFRLSASMTPARDVGGDFYDFFMLDQTHLAFMVADVSGKGVTAALYMMNAKTLLKNAMLALRDPAAAFSQVNAELCRSNTANMFLTAWGGVLDLETGLVTFVNAGHNPPVKVVGRKPEDEKPEDHRTEYIMKKSGPVLAFLDGIEYKARTLFLKPGDTLFLYTDGVTEAFDREGELFGEERLADALNAVAEPDPKVSCNVVRMAVAAFAEGVPQADDLTVLAVEYVSRPNLFVRSFPPTPDGIEQASCFLDESLEKSLNNLPASAAAALHVIVDEITSNIVKHSRASGFELDVQFLEESSSVKLIFMDDGEPYDPLSHVDPDTTLPAEERPVGGLGILMVKKMSNSVSYERIRNRNCLTVFKQIERGLAPAENGETT